VRIWVDLTNSPHVLAMRPLIAAARADGREVTARAFAQTPSQRDEVRRLGAFTMPERAVDAQSLVAYADLVVSAGGTMNREAVALGTPV
jgi:predicted glycosyltransferase